MLVSLDIHVMKTINDRNSQAAHTLLRDRIELEVEDRLDAKSKIETAGQSRNSQSRSADQEEYITLKEVAQHNLSQDAWVIVNGQVIESVYSYSSSTFAADHDSVTDFHKSHPGGSAIIVTNAGTDVS